jgi:hypothetical protein
VNPRAPPRPVKLIVTAGFVSAIDSFLPSMGQPSMHARFSAAVFGSLLLVPIMLLPATARAQPSVRDLMAQCTSSNPVQNLACRNFIDGFVAGVAVHVYNERANYCLGRPIDDYVRAFLTAAARSESLRAAPDASIALFQAMTGQMGTRHDCLKP